MDSTSAATPFKTCLILFTTFLVPSGEACSFRLTESEGTFAPPMYPLAFDINLCTWEIEAPIGKVVEITFKEVLMDNSTDLNGLCQDCITVSDGVASSQSAIIPPFCGDGPGWPRSPLQLLSKTQFMTITLRKELVGSIGFRASYKHVEQREEIVAVVAVENPAIILFNRFASLSSVPHIPLIGASNPSALSLDVIGEYFYFTDIQAKFIGRVRLRPPYSAVEKLITNHVENPLGVAVAYLTGLLYWTDADRHEVSVSRLDGTYRKSIMTSIASCRMPRGVILSRDQTYIFWTCESRIVKSKADGSERNLDFVSGGIVNPTALAIDPDGIYIYWMDTHLGVIDRIRVDGADRANQLSSDSGFFTNLHSFVMSEFTFYWTHPSEKRMYYYGKREHEQQLRFVYLVQEQTFGGLSYYRSDLQIPVQHLCSTENGGCSELCFPDGMSVKCDDVTPSVTNCPDDIVEISSSPYLTINWIEPTAVSRSSDQIKILRYQSRSHAPMSPFIRGTTEVTYVFRDDLGYKAVCIFNVTLQTRTSTTSKVPDLPVQVTKASRSSTIQPTTQSGPSSNEDTLFSSSLSLYIVVGSAILVVCLTTITIVIAILCYCAYCNKRRESGAEQTLPMKSQLVPWTKKLEPCPPTPIENSHYVTKTFIEDSGEYLEVAY